MQSALSLKSYPDDMSLATNQKRALDYFGARLWPLFFTSLKPCPAPVSLARHSSAVLQAACIFADAHRALQDRGQSSQALISKRSNCLATVREDLVSDTMQKSTLHLLLVAVLLLYLMDGYVDCTQQHASTQAHLAGAVAIINALGGFHAVRSSAEMETNMLLSEFASTDLTDALLRGRKPSFPANIWLDMESGPVWWDPADHASASLGNVFATLARMSFYVHELQNEDLCPMETVDAFERTLQPSFPSLGNFVQLASDANDAESQAVRERTIFSQSLCRAFQHAAMIYLYRSVCCIATPHVIVQQHVQACLECINGIGVESKVNNCTLFPLYIAGAHSLSQPQRDAVTYRLDAIYGKIRFQSIHSMKASLEQIWQPSYQPGAWNDTFTDLTIGTLVI